MDDLDTWFTDEDYQNLDDLLKKDMFPLYTHPVNPKYDPETGEPLIDGYPLFSGLPHPVKELTDEEIIEIGLLTTDPRFSHIESPLLLEFARAILRKAQK